MKKNNSLLNLLGLLVVAVSMSPIYLALTSSLKRKSDLSSKWIFSKDITLENFKQVLSDPRFLMSMKNTTFMVVGALLIVIILGSITGYALARLNTKLSRGINVFVLGVMMVPVISLMVPIYQMMIKMNLVNSMLGAVILIGTYSLPLSIFMYTNFIKAIPTALDEAAKIDGCNEMQTFFKIILPQLIPITVSIIIITGVKIYNNYMIAFYILQADTKRVATTYVANFFTENPNLNLASAAALMSSLPVILVYLALQKHFIAGATEGITK